MKFIHQTLMTLLITVAIQLIGSQAVCLGAPVGEKTPGESEQSAAGKKFPDHSYDNGTNFLTEGWIPVTDNLGKRAVWSAPDRKPGEEKIPDVKFEIVWTMPEQSSWNYSVPELHDGKGLYKSQFPSTPLFFERTLKAKTILSVNIADTPYSFFILDGAVSPYFYDSKKAVIWRLNGTEMDTLFHRMNSISASSGKLSLSAAGGDMAEFLTVDYSSQNAAPAIRYWRRFDGP